jgi:hypothetical protein
VLTGVARLAQEAKDNAQETGDRQAAERRRREMQQEQANLQARADAIAQRLMSIGNELQIAKQHEKERRQISVKEREELSHARGTD